MRDVAPNSNTSAVLWTWTCWRGFRSCVNSGAGDLGMFSHAFLISARAPLVRDHVTLLIYWLSLKHRSSWNAAFHLHNLIGWFYICCLWMVWLQSIHIHYLNPDLGVYMCSLSSSHLRWPSLHICVVEASSWLQQNDDIPEDEQPWLQLMEILCYLFSPICCHQ